MATKIQDIRWYYQHLLRWKRSEIFWYNVQKLSLLRLFTPERHPISTKIKLKLKGSEVFVGVLDGGIKPIPIAKLYFLYDDTNLMCDSLVQGERNKTFEQTTRTGPLKDHLIDLAAKALKLS